MFSTLAAVIAVLALASEVPAQEQAGGADDPAALATKLANPIASLISLPLQYNFDHHMGADDKGAKSVLNVQPVVPISLGDEWNVISRTILPLVETHDMPYGSESGIGDVLQSLFFSPKAPTAGGIIWGAGPALLFPTASEEVLGSGRWGAGPTAVALKQSGPWTYGALANHIWSYAGDSEREEVNATFFQPFASYLVKKTYTSFALNTEVSYDWSADAWSVPVNLTVAQMLKIAGQPFQVTVGPRFWADSPDGGPEGWGLRAGLTLLFPK